MRGVVLDSTGKPARPHGLTILVPKGYEDGEKEPIGRCTVPGCGARFYAGEEQAWQRHVGSCARANLDRIRSSIEAMPIMEDFDPEVSEHMRGVGRRMLAEGRLEVKPSERAGFS